MGRQWGKDMGKTNRVCQKGGWERDGSRRRRIGIWEGCVRKERLCGVLGRVSGRERFVEEKRYLACYRGVGRRKGCWVGVDGFSGWVNKATTTSKH